MKQLLWIVLALLSTITPVQAEPIAWMPHGNGRVTLHDVPAKCPSGQFLAIGTHVSSPHFMPVLTGCWRRVLDQVVVRWDRTGAVVLYAAAHFTLKPNQPSNEP